MTDQTIPPCPVCGTAPMLVPPSLPKLPTIKRYLNVDCECVIRALGQLVSLSDWTKGVNATLGSACRELGIETVEQFNVIVRMACELRNMTAIHDYEEQVYQKIVPEIRAEYE